MAPSDKRIECNTNPTKEGKMDCYDNCGKNICGPANLDIPPDCTSMCMIGCNIQSWFEGTEEDSALVQEEPRIGWDTYRESMVRPDNERISKKVWFGSNSVFLLGDRLYLNYTVQRGSWIELLPNDLCVALLDEGVKDFQIWNVMEGADYLEIGFWEILLHDGYVPFERFAVQYTATDGSRRDIFVGVDGFPSPEVLKTTYCGWDIPYPYYEL